MNTINSFSPGALGQLGSLGGMGHSKAADGASFSEAPSFGEALSNSLQEVNNLQQDADQAVESLFTGGSANSAEVLTAVQKADLAFRTMMQIRNKLVAAYDELKNIRV
jgi:flagellar hook-basal body complex protein FliE